MNRTLNFVLAKLDEHRIRVLSDTKDPEGFRLIVVGCGAPQIPFGLGRILYYTIVIAPGQEDISLDEREAMRRRLWHTTTDIFGDDAAGLTGLDDVDISDLLADIPDLPDPDIPDE